MFQSAAEQGMRLQYRFSHVLTLVRHDCEALAAFLGLPILRKYLREACKTWKGTALTLVYLACAVGVLGAAVWLASEGPEPPPKCPAQAPAKKTTIPDGPSSMWLQAVTAKGANEWSPAVVPTLKRCVAWSAAAGALPPLEEVRAQMKCHAALVKATFSEEAAGGERKALVERARNVMGAIQGISARCSAVHTKLQGMSVGGAGYRQPTDAVVTLGGLANFEGSVREAGMTLNEAANLLHTYAKTESEATMQLIASTRRQLHSCVFKTAREARRIAHTLPLSNPAIRQVQLCRPDMLGGLERLAVYDFQAELPSVFFKGLLMSEIATAPKDAPLFGKPEPTNSEWAADMYGLQAPRGVVFAEQMLLKGFDGLQTSEVDEASKALIMQLAAHAKLLAQLKQYAAAERRYQNAVEVARTHSHTQMEASALAQLSFFLSMHGDQEQALQAATNALRLGDDALASYLQATLRINLGGELRTDEQVRAAAAQLAGLQGKLPTEELEQARAAAVAKLEVWRKVSEDQSLKSCFGFDDAAQILVCTVGKIAEALTA
eukprot:TRINITY_DN112500_c0_g1_i1.p1 TRINITY_DN112500_c0_g1~~TRINITY_DN112500_c0_g1_i1.p1  ORF type:complete len:549 (+),score=170.76 TRINITY_DN112500_c0_g1_i1:93-1739(+)